ncbi:hypothetical protein SBA3_180020 [Candidatus Sulfopaludibacter sp. SbA3]|nr:hypothetical protein SBA3_180020 [Candidatus Sulfopaludibacter sp. SbA3]
MPADFPAQQVCRTSFLTYESYMGMAGNLVERADRYALSDRGSAGVQGNRAIRTGLSA